MCLILFAHRAHPEYRLVLAANRDEFYDRPTAPAAPWPDAPGVVAGRDLRGGGTWLAVGPGGRWAALTNHRDPAEFGRAAPSRGELVAGFLRGGDPPAAYLARLAPRAGEYNGFNLLVGDAAGVHWLGNRSGTGPREVEPGVHGLSNAHLDTPWPKVTRGTAALGTLLRPGATPAPDPLLEILLDDALAADHDLPDTGVERALERALSAMFIRTPGYGTRSSTALLVRHDGSSTLVERSYAPGGPPREARHSLPPA